MKKCLLFLFIGATMSLSAQWRYYEEVFSVQKTADIEYGVNIDFLLSDLTDPVQIGADVTALKTAVATAQPIPAHFFTPGDTSSDVKVTSLKMDVYEPANDSKTDRPVVIYVHTGNFLPPVLNGSPLGDKADPVAVELCERWAKRGFVAVSHNYRLGWNPIATTEAERRGTLLNAVYRALHDTKHLVRHLKDNASTYGIDPNKIVLYGQGSGGYVALAYATLDRHAEITIQKFINPISSPPASYVDTAQVGNLDGFNGLLNLYLPSATSADVSMTVNAGGALADTSWLEAGDVPMVSFQCPRDPFAPFDNGIVVVPTTQGNVVEVQGPNEFMLKVNALGNNSVFNSAGLNDPYTLAAQAKYNQTIPFFLPPPNDNLDINAGIDGVFPFILPLGASRFQNQGSPWEWWDPNSPAAMATPPGGSMTTHQSSLLSNPNMSETKGKTYVDTIMGYSLPRMFLALSLDSTNISIDENELNNAISVYPNPIQNVLYIDVKDPDVKTVDVEILDITGRSVARLPINDGAVETSQLKSGTYVIHINTNKGVLTRKVLKR